jgi:hypothetical protein
MAKAAFVPAASGIYAVDVMGLPHIAVAGVADNADHLVSHARAPVTGLPFE